MIKRRFYRQEHGDKDDASDSSSSSDSEVEAQTSEESEDDTVTETKENNDSCSTSSGYESEDSSAEEIEANSAGGVTDDDDEGGSDTEVFARNPLFSKHHTDETKSNGTDKASVPVDIPDSVLQIKSVFRCRICPRVLCLTLETMKAHLNSKRHARSEKLLKENRLKAMLNSDGEIENQETALEMHARIVALAEDKQQKNKNKNRKRKPKQNLSTKENANGNLPLKKAKKPTASLVKRRRKNEK